MGGFVHILLLLAVAAILIIRHPRAVGSGLTGGGGEYSMVSKSSSTDVTTLRARARQHVEAAGGQRLQGLARGSKMWSCAS